MSAAHRSMRRLVAGLLIALAICGICHTGWAQDCRSEVESNDSFGSANYGGVVSEWVCFEGEIIDGNEDYFTFELEDHLWVAVGTMLDEGDSTLTVYDEAGVELGYNDDRPGGARESLIQGCLPPGLYHVLVGAYAGQGSFGYRLSIEVLRPCEAEPLPECYFEEWEPNETLELADFGAELPEEYCFRATIRPGDVDYFGFEVTLAHDVIIATMSPTGGDTVLTLFDEIGTEIAVNDDNPAGGVESFIEVCLEPGRYYAAVRGFDPSLLFDYVLRIESGGACGSASSTSADWYAFSAPLNNVIAPSKQNQKYLVLMVLPSDVNLPAGITAQTMRANVRQKLDTGAQSAGGFWAEATYGKTTFTFDVHDKVITLGKKWEEYYKASTPKRIDGSGATYPVTWTGTETLKLSSRNSFSVTVTFPAGQQTLNQVVIHINNAINAASGGGAVEIRARANSGQLRLESTQRGDKAVLSVDSGTAKAKLGLGSPTVTAGVNGINKRHDVFIEALTARVQGMTDAAAETYLKQFAGVIVTYAVDNAGFYRADASGWGKTDQFKVRGKPYYYASIYITAADAWTTYAHEIGHNLGLPDLYDEPPPNLVGVELWDWCIMENCQAAHPTTWMKAYRSQKPGSTEAGYNSPWMPATEIKTIVAPPPGGNITPVEVLLLPTGVKMPGINPFAASHPTAPLVHSIRIEMGKGHNLYVTAREKGPYQHAQLGKSDYDTTIPAEGVIVTDAIDTWNVGVNRAAVTLLTPYANPINTVGEYYEQNTSAISKLKVECLEVVGSNPTVYRMKVTWGTGSYFDLRIDPWTPEPWESPDIWVDTRVDNGWDVYKHSDASKNPSVTGHPVDNGDRSRVGWPSRVYARVWNDGDKDASNVQVTFRVVVPPGSASGVQIGKRTIPTIKANSYALAYVEWTPGSHNQKHVCIKADVTYQPGELNANNNSAQENITDWYLARSSPYQPVEFVFQVENPLDELHQFRLGVVGLVDGYHVEVTPIEFWLSPGESIEGRARILAEDWVALEDVGEGVLGPLVSLDFLGLISDRWIPIGGVSGYVHPVRASTLEAGIDPSGRDGHLSVRAFTAAGPIVGTNVTARLVDRNGTELALEQAPTDGYGTVSMVLSLPAGYPTGEAYRVEVVLSPGNGTGPAERILEVRFD